MRPGADTLRRTGRCEIVEERMDPSAAFRKPRYRGKMVVPVRGFEPLRPCGLRILSPNCLPVPAHRHVCRSARFPGSRIIQPSDAGPAVGPDRSVPQRLEKAFGDGALAAEAAHVRRVVHCAEHADGLLLGVAKPPDCSAFPALRVVDRPPNSEQTVSSCLDPIHESVTCGNERNVEAIIDVSRVFLAVISIGVDENRPVAIDTATQEVGKVVVGNRQWSERETLGRREADVQKPVIEVDVAPGQSVAPISITAPMRSDGRA